MKRYAILILCLCLFACGGTDHKSTPAKKYPVLYTVQSESGCFTRARIDYDDQDGRHYIQSDLPFAYNFECIEGDFLYISVDPGLDANRPECIDCTDLKVKIKYLGCILNQGWMPQPGDRWITSCYAFHIPDTLYFDY